MDVGEKKYFHFLKVFLSKIKFELLKNEDKILFSFKNYSLSTASYILAKVELRCFVCDGPYFRSSAESLTPTTNTLKGDASAMLLWHITHPLVVASGFPSETTPTILSSAKLLGPAIRTHLAGGGTPIIVAFLVIIPIHL